MEETTGLSCSATVANVSQDRPFHFNRSVRQGGVESAWQWNLPMRMVLDRLVDSWAQRHLGIELPGVGLVNHLLWADNVYFLAHSREGLQTMIAEFSSSLYELGLRWKPSSLEFVHTCSGDAMGPLTVDVGPNSFEFKNVAQMLVLGSVISTSRVICDAVEHRLQKGSACFWSLRDVLLAKDLSLKVRFCEYCKRVQPVVAFSAGGWVWSKQLFNMLYQWENVILRRMLSLKRRPDEQFAKFVKRSTHTARRFFHEGGH
eukprot:10961462-Karenia_brevis.AAC.1